MQELNIPPMLWLVGFQMGLYAVAWGLCGALLGEDRVAVVHWGASAAMGCSRANASSACCAS